MRLGEGSVPAGKAFSSTGFFARGEKPLIRRFAPPSPQGEEEGVRGHVDSTSCLTLACESAASVVKGPYVAETIKVAVESDYVVVEI